MRLLITTQIVDTNDPTLSFFHRWLEEFSKHCESIEVICLKEGEHTLPANVHVHSLGKEKGNATSLTYALRFKSLAFTLRHQYDEVYVHMNQEYVLLAGPLWKLYGKPIYMWRNHYSGSFLTDIAVSFCTKVFCTSRYSYTAKFKKTVFMPVGVDTQRFSTVTNSKQVPNSILFFARIAPSKHPEVLMQSLAILQAKKLSFTASFYGSPLPKDVPYYESLKNSAEDLGLQAKVRFFSGVPNEEALDIFRAHEIFVNCSPSGMFDKMIFEAAASGCVVLAESKDFEKLAGTEFSFTDPVTLATRLEALLLDTSVVKEEKKKHLTEITQSQSLAILGDKLFEELKPIP